MSRAARSTRSTRCATLLGVESGARDRLLRRGHDAGGDAGGARRARARRTRSRARPSSPRRSISPTPATSACSSTTTSCELIEQRSAPSGFLDGRYMAATFNLLRGRDLIWNYVINNYLMGEDYPPFDLLHWNGDVTNLPAQVAPSYLTDLYRDNKLVGAGRARRSTGTPIDLTKVETPTYVQAGREDHIAPAESVWKITHHFKGPLKLRAGGLGPYRRRGQPAGGGQIPILDQRPEGRDARRIRRRRDRRPRAAGGRTGSDWIESVDATKVRCKRRTRARARASSRRSKMRRGAMCARAKAVIP